MTKIMIIRHAEKPGDEDDDRGVSSTGHHDAHALTVRGWQRAGALVRFFMPAGAFAEGSPLATPRAIVASAAVKGSPSLRAQLTVRPLAQALGLSIDNRHPEGDELCVAELVQRIPSPVLVAWHHNSIRHLVRAIAGERLPCPDWWPDDRFDVVWVLDRDEDGAWRFCQEPMLLLAGDRAGVL